MTSSTRTFQSVSPKEEVRRESGKDGRGFGDEKRKRGRRSRMIRRRRREDGTEEER